MNLDEVGVMIKSIIVSTKNDVLLNDIDREFREETGIRIPYKKFEHDTLESFLKSIDGVHLTKNSYGEMVVKAHTENARHIQELVQEQRSSRRKRGSRGRRGGGKENSSRRPSFTVRKGNFRSNAKPQSIYRSTPKIVNPSPPKRSKSPPKRKPLSQVNQPTTQDSVQDVRGLPFKVVSNTFNEEECKNKDKNKEKDPAACKENDQRKVEYILDDIFTDDSELDEDLLSNKFDMSLQITIGRGITRLVEEIPNSLKKDDCHQPVIAGYTLFGDDYFYKFAKEYLNSVQTEKGMIGLCRENLTVGIALKMFRRQITFPKKMVVLLGGSDLLHDLGPDDIAYDYYSLLNELSKKVEDVKVCTIPLFVDQEKDKYLFNDLGIMNGLIKSIPEDYDKNIEIIDLYHHFSMEADFLGIDVFEFFSEDYNFKKRGLALLGTILKEYLCNKK